MKASELRIGNYLTTDYDYLCEVELIHKKHFDCRELTTGLFIPNGIYKPIILNEDWLIKYNHSKLDKELFSIEYEYNEIQLTFKGDGYNVDIGGIVIAFVQYVHEWQNTYFALTKKELTINS